MDNGANTVRRIIYGLLIILAFLFSLSVSAGSSQINTFWRALGTQLIILIISVLIYQAKDYRETVFGIPTKTIGISFVIGVIVGFVYIFATSLLPGLAIAQPLVPASVGSGTQWFLINILAPIAETIFFLGALLAYIREFKPTRNRIIIALIINSVLFAAYHLGSYILGIFDYSARQGIFALSSNISVFASAFIFNMIAGSLVVKKNIRNLLVAIIIHAMINFSYWTSNKFVGSF